MLGFWFFYGAIYAVYWRLSHHRQNTLLLIASYVFYAWWDYRFLFLILVSTVIDFIGGLGVAGVEVPRPQLRKINASIVAAALLLCTNINYPLLLGSLAKWSAAGLSDALPHRWTDLIVPIVTAVIIGAYGIVLPKLCAAPAERRRRQFLVISMVANLAILGFFKYFDFFAGSADRLLHAIGLGHIGISPLGIILPAGISFYTFQAMSYTIDIYRGDVEPTRSFRDFALFVCFFPHLVAGPIMRAHTLLPQVTGPRARKPGAAEEGLLLVFIGMFKKIVIADNMAPVASAIFQQVATGHAAHLTASDVLVGVYAFAFQIYGDFSGYSSIARGISKWIGFELVVNFRMPYLAVSPSDFWRRWHISLSSWLRDYLYIPLGGNRNGIAAMYRNLMITMLLGGLWHGASWTFVAWGLYHGLILCIFRAAGISEDVRPTGTFGRLKWLFRVACMFHLTCFGWLLFRADSFATVASMLSILVHRIALSHFAVAALAYIGFHTAILFAIEWVMDGERRLDRFLLAPRAMQVTGYLYMTFMMIVFHAERAFEFIYFQF